MAKEVFDVDDVVLMVDGVDISEYLDDAAVTIERAEDKKVRYSLKGKPLVSKNPEAKHATVKFKLLQDSAFNIILQAKDTFSIAVLDMNVSKRAYTASVAHVMKLPNDTVGTDEAGEYEVLAEYMKKDMIGSL